MKEITEKLGVEMVYKCDYVKEPIPAYYKANENGIATIHFVSYKGETHIVVEMSFAVKKDKNGHRVPDNKYYEIEESEIEELFRVTTWQDFLDPQPLREALEILESIKD